MVLGVGFLHQKFENIIDFDLKIGSAPLTAVQLLWVNLIMDTPGALALATEPPHDGLMNRPPIGRGVGFITKAMWRNIAGQSIYQMAVLFVFLTLQGSRFWEFMVQMLGTLSILSYSN